MNIISFKKKKKEYTGCKHENILVDKELWQLECADCGELLDPIAYIIRLAEMEGDVEIKYDYLLKKVNDLQERTRFKCKYCGKVNTL